MNADVKSRFLDLSALAELERMRFVTRSRIEGSYTGRHRSRQQGGSGEFVDFREYSGGEDLRRLDWKVFARTGKAFVRLHEEETNLVCTLALDGSGSMEFRGARRGSASKLEYLQFLATALSHVISQGRDQVGLAVLNERLEQMIPPGGAPMHIRRVQEAIERMEPRPTTQMAASLRDLFERSHTRGVLALMSDFLMDDLEGVFAVVRLFRRRGWEVIALHIVHPEEERLPEGVAWRFEGLEDDGRVDCNPADIQVEYEERFAAHLAMVRQLALSAGCDYRRVSTATSYLQTLGAFLVERAG